MKKILIIGANSYIGTSFDKYLQTQFADGFIVDTVDALDDTWRETSFVGYDSVFHVAGIAHSDSGRISAEQEKAYYAINTDLTLDVAQKAKAEGVGQFIFMSSIIVYGESAPIGQEKVITKDTPVNPSNCYGDSKRQAECGLVELEDEAFRVAILRSPMIYGPGSKGNYPLLSKIAQKLPIFPLVHNQRSMLYIENLCEFVRLLVLNGERGVFHPQNAVYSNTSEMISLIAQAHGKRVRLVKGWAWLLKVVSCFTKLVNKAFGNLVYDMELSQYREEYRRYDLKESVWKTETQEKG